MKFFGMLRVFVVLLSACLLVAVDPNYAQAYINRAFILSFIDRNVEALASLESYIALVGEANLTARETELLASLREATE